MLFKVLFCLLSLSIIVASIFFGQTVKFSEQWVLYEALRTTASIIFAVAGVWLAIIYLDRLKSPYKKSSYDPVHLKGFAQLFSPVINSVITLCAILLVGITAPILKQLIEPEEYIIYFRQASMGFLALLTMFQIYTVLSVLVPVLNIIDKNEQDKHATEIINKLKGHRD